MVQYFQLLSSIEQIAAINGSNFTLFQKIVQVTIILLIIVIWNSTMIFKFWLKLMSPPDGLC